MKQVGPLLVAKPGLSPADSSWEPAVSCLHTLGLPSTSPPPLPLCPTPKFSQGPPLSNWERVAACAQTAPPSDLHSQLAHWSSQPLNHVSPLPVFFSIPSSGSPHRESVPSSLLWLPQLPSSLKALLHLPLHEDSLAHHKPESHLLPRSPLASSSLNPGCLPRAEEMSLDSSLRS